MDERAQQRILRRESRGLAMNLLLCAVSGALVLPLGVVVLQLAVQCSAARELDYLQRGR